MEISAPHITYVSNLIPDPPSPQTRDGRTRSTAYLTIQEAVDDAEASPQKKGQTIMIGPGTYDEQVTATIPLHFVGSGWGTKITFTTTQSNQNILGVVPGSTVRNLSISSPLNEAGRLTCIGITPGNPDPRDSPLPLVIDTISTKIRVGLAALVQHTGTMWIRDSDLLGDEYSVVYRNMFACDSHVATPGGAYSLTSAAAFFSVPFQGFTIFDGAQGMIARCFVRGFRGDVGTVGLGGYAIQIAGNGSHGWTRAHRSTLLSDSRSIDHPSFGVNAGDGFILDISNCRIEALQTAGGVQDDLVIIGDDALATLFGTVYRPFTVDPAISTGKIVNRNG